MLSGMCTIQLRRVVPAPTTLCLVTTFRRMALIGTPARSSRVSVASFQPVILHYAPALFQSLSDCVSSPYYSVSWSITDTNKVQYTNGSLITVATRERPKLIFDPTTNQISHLSTGTCVATTCPPVPPVNCKTLYWDYTLVQPVGRHDAQPGTSTRSSGKIEINQTAEASEAVANISHSKNQNRDYTQTAHQANDTAMELAVSILKTDDHVQGIVERNMQRQQYTGEDGNFHVKTAVETEFSFGDASSLLLEFDGSNSLRQITAGGGRTFLSGVTPTWALTATDCKSAFPAFGAAPATSQFYSLAVNRTHHIETDPGGSTLVLRWGNVKVSESMITVEVRIDIRSSSPDSAAWSGSVVSPAGCCVQSFSLVDLRTLRWNPSGGDRLFLPVMQGIITDCAQFISTHDVTVCGAAHPELSGEGLERSEHPWVPNGGERTMGWLALLAAASAEGSHPAQALYIGAHDPEGRMKLLPAAASGSSALLRHVAIPDDLQDSVAGNWSTQYSTVLSIVNGSWYEAAQIYKTWALIGV